MKNVIKVLGIIAMFAIIGLGSCEVDEEEQTTITVIGIPTAFNGKYAYVGVSDDISGSNIREFSLPKQITNGTVSRLSLLNVKDNKAATAKNGYIKLQINSQEDLEGAMLYSGVTSGPKNLGEGDKTVDATEDFYPNIQDAAKKYQADNTNYKDEKTYFGTYTTIYKSGLANDLRDVTETIKLSETLFTISDNEKVVFKTGTVDDSLEFTIKEWTNIDNPDITYKTKYPNAFKFKGKMTKQVGTSFVPSPRTAPSPGFSSADVKADESGPDCWMYVYFDSTYDGFTFVRTAFSKTDTNGAVIKGTDGADRVYSLKK